MKPILLRFSRVLIASFLAGVLAQLSAGTSISSLEDLKKFGYSLLVAGITASAVAADKAFRMYLNEDQSTEEGS